MAFMRYQIEIILLIIIIFIAGFHEGECITCYNCDSLTNASCASDLAGIEPIQCTNTTQFPIMNLTKMSNYKDLSLSHMGVRNQIPGWEPEFACFKLVAEGNKIQVTVRGCIEKKIGKIVCLSMEDNSYFCEICDDKDACNSSFTIKFKLMLMIFSLCISLSWLY